MVLMPRSDHNAPHKTLRFGWLLIVLLTAALVAGLVAIRSHHPPRKWTDLPDQAALAGGTTLGTGGGEGPGTVALQPVTTPTAVHVRFTCEGAGTVGIAYGGLAGSGSCYRDGRTEFQLNLPPTMVPPELNVYASPGVIWKVAVSI